MRTITNNKKRTNYAKFELQGVRGFIVAPFASSKKATKLVLVEGDKRIRLNGRQVNTLTKLIRTAKRASNNK